MLATHLWPSQHLHLFSMLRLHIPYDWLNPRIMLLLAYVCFLRSSEFDSLIFMLKSTKVDHVGVTLPRFCTSTSFAAPCKLLAKCITCKCKLWSHTITHCFSFSFSPHRFLFSLALTSPSSNSRYRLGPVISSGGISLVLSTRPAEQLSGSLLPPSSIYLSSTSNISSSLKTLKLHIAVVWPVNVKWMEWSQSAELIIRNLDWFTLGTFQLRHLGFKRAIRSMRSVGAAGGAGTQHGYLHIYLGHILSICACINSHTVKHRNSHIFLWLWRCNTSWHI